MEIKKSTSDYLIELLRSTVREEQPKEKPADVEWSDLRKLAVYHKVEEMVFYAVAKLDNKPMEEEASKWFGLHEKNQIVHTIQSGEAEVIIAEATAHGIDILPMKGAVLRNIYPKAEFRQMGDLDYLVNSDPSIMKQMGEILHEMGYWDEDDVGIEAINHDGYRKPPYMMVEIHRRLLLKSTEENRQYTEGIWERLERDKDIEHLLHMTLEDFYLFHLIHFEKHYSMGGSGIRSIVDQYYLMKEYKNQMDWDYINRFLYEMNYVAFEKMCRELAEAWFGDGELTKDLEAPAEYIINSGAFGTFEQYQKWRFEQYQKEYGIKTKKGMFFRRMFMERERMELIYPSLGKHGWLLPFCWVHRLVKSILFKRDRIKRELKSFKE